MKVLFIAGTLGKGGAEKQLYYLCKLLKEKGHNVRVISFTSGEYYENEIKKIGVEVEIIPSFKNKLIKLFSILKIVKRFNPDILFGFHFYTGIYVGLLGRLLKIKSFGSIRSNGIAEKSANGILSWLHFSLPNKIVANSKNAIENCNKIFYKKKMTYLPNIIDLDYFEYKTKENSEVINLLFIGSLKEVKHPNLFIELVNKLVQDNIRVKAKVIGQGNLMETLKVQSKNLPIEFLGNIDDVRPFLYEADYLISTSKLEGTPNVMLEAFATGTPVLALYHDGLSEWVEAGYLPKLNSIAEMSHLAVNKTLSKLEFNRKYIEKEHSPEIIFKKFETIINSIKG